MAPTPEVPAVPVTFRDATERLRESLPGYEERPQQTFLAESIEQTWRDGTILVGQAGTGTGKSLAALIPAILSGERTVYSTATKALQAQVMQKDLPFLAEHLGKSFKYAMLQGIGNYFCHLRAVENANENPVIAANVQHVLADDSENAESDSYTFDGLRENLPVEVDNVSWSKMTISSDDCVRKQCPYYTTCRFMRARTKAASADIVVANHALVALNGRIMQMTDRNVNLLGDVRHLIVDECHELAEYITNALTVRQSIATYRSFHGEVNALVQTGEFSEDAAELENQAMRLTAAADRFFNLYEIPDGQSSVRIRHREAVENSEVVETMIACLQEISMILGHYAEDADDYPKEIKSRYVRVARRAHNMTQGLIDFLLKSDGEMVRMFESEFQGGGRRTYLKVIPVEVGAWAREWLWSTVSPTLISATVLVDGSADFTINQLGLKDDSTDDKIVTIDVGSPFDFERQARLYVPKHLPEPSARGDRAGWERQMIELIHELVTYSDGRALLLFTSNGMMRKAYDALEDRLPYPCRKQGDLPNAQLTHWFREETHSVLFATRSFFTGIDIQGDSLSLVVIDKLPFPVPTEPVFEARSELIDRRGGRAFNELSIPMMTLPLQQAFGRLVRTKADHGVVAIMDPRLETKGYGNKICRSLPAPVTHSMDEIAQFFASLAAPT